MEKLIRNPNKPPTHPGILLRDVVLPDLKKNHKLTIHGLADILNISRQALHRILKGEAPVSVDTALKLGKLCGNGESLWLNMQSKYDVYFAKQTIELDDIPTFAA